MAPWRPLAHHEHVPPLGPLFRPAVPMAPVLVLPPTIPRIRPRLDAQPIVDLRTGSLVREELLMSSLPHAERREAATALDRLVVRAGALAAGRGRRVAVNLSGRAIGDPSFLTVVERALAINRVAPGMLMFELADLAAIPSLRVARRFAKRVVSLGCALALDGFGADHGGLAYVEALQFSVLKIDPQYVAGVLTNPGSRSVVESSVDLARLLGLTTVADGVENGRIRDAVRDLGVDHGQGFHLGRAAPFVPMAPPPRP